MDATSLLDAYLARELAAPEGHPYRPVRPATHYSAKRPHTVKDQGLKTNSSQLPRSHAGEHAANNISLATGSNQGFSQRSQATPASHGSDNALAPPPVRGPQQHNRRSRDTAEPTLPPRQPLQPNTARRLPVPARAQAKKPSQPGAVRGLPQAKARLQAEKPSLATARSTVGARIPTARANAESSALAKLRSRSMARLAAADRSEALRKSKMHKSSSGTSEPVLTAAQLATAAGRSGGTGSSDLPNNSSGLSEEASSSTKEMAETVETEGQRVEGGAQPRTTQRSISKNQRKDAGAQLRTVYRSVSEPARGLSSSASSTTQSTLMLKGPNAWPPPPEIKKSQQPQHTADLSAPQSSSLAQRRTQSLGSIKAPVLAGQIDSRRQGFTSEPVAERPVDTSQLAEAGPEDHSLGQEKWRRAVVRHSDEGQGSSEDENDLTVDEGGMRSELLLPSPPQLGRKATPTISPLFVNAPGKRSTSVSPNARLLPLPASLSFDSLSIDSLETQLVPRLSASQQPFRLLSSSREVSPKRVMRQRPFRSLSGSQTLSRNSIVHQQRQSSSPEEPVASSEQTVAKSRNTMTDRQNSQDDEPLADSDLDTALRRESPEACQITSDISHKEGDDARELQNLPDTLEILQYEGPMSHDLGSIGVESASGHEHDLQEFLRHERATSEVLGIALKESADVPQQQDLHEAAQLDLPSRAGLQAGLDGRESEQQQEESSIASRDMSGKSELDTISENRGELQQRHLQSEDAHWAQTGQDDVTVLPDEGEPQQRIQGQDTVVQKQADLGAAVSDERGQMQHQQGMSVTAPKEQNDLAQCGVALEQAIKLQQGQIMVATLSDGHAGGESPRDLRTLSSSGQSAGLGGKQHAPMQVAPEVAADMDKPGSQQASHQESFARADETSTASSASSKPGTEPIERASRPSSSRQDEIASGHLQTVGGSGQILAPTEDISQPGSSRDKPLHRALRQSASSRQPVSKPTEAFRQPSIMHVQAHGQPVTVPTVARSQPAGTRENPLFGASESTSVVGKGGVDTSSSSQGALYTLPSIRHHNSVLRRKESAAPSVSRIQIPVQAIQQGRTETLSASSKQASSLGLQQGGMGMHSASSAQISRAAAREKNSLGFSASLAKRRIETGSYAAAANALLSWEPQRARRKAPSESLRGGKVAELAGGGDGEAAGQLLGSGAEAVREAVARRVTTAASPASEMTRGLQHLRERWKGFCATRPKSQLAEQKPACTPGPEPFQRPLGGFPQPPVTQACEVVPLAIRDAGLAAHDRVARGSEAVSSRAQALCGQIRVPVIASNMPSLGGIGGRKTKLLGTQPCDEPHYDFISTAAGSLATASAASAATSAIHPYGRLSPSESSFSSADASLKIESTASGIHRGQDGDSMPSSTAWSSAGNEEAADTNLSGGKIRSSQPGGVMSHPGTQYNSSRRSSTTGSITTVGRLTKHAAHRAAHEAENRSEGITAVSRTAPGIDDEDDSSEEGYGSAITGDPGKARLERAWQEYFQRGMARVLALEAYGSSDWTPCNGAPPSEWETSMSAPSSVWGIYVSGSGSDAWAQPLSRRLSAISGPSEPCPEEKIQSPRSSSQPASADEVLLLPYYSLAAEGDRSTQG